MESGLNVFDEYKRLLYEGELQKAYRGIIQFMMHLRTRLKAEYPDHEVSRLYQGYMDMTYFAFTPASLSSLGLKIAIVFLHESFAFQVWLSARSKPLQEKYVTLLNQVDWQLGTISIPGPGVDSIIEQVLVSTPDFENQKSLSDQILLGTLGFAKKVESLLTGQPNL